jgi:2-octaprenyl-6-methoxyphenol hydroxylase
LGRGATSLAPVKHDVIILGGGPNGLATALALGGHKLPRPLNILLLDMRDPTAPSTDTRGTALTRASIAMFTALGLGENLEPHLAEMRDIIVTDAIGQHDRRPSLLTFDTDDNAKAAASMVENHVLHAALAKAVQSSPSIKIQSGFSFASFDAQPGKISLTSLAGESHTASLLIAADGRNSTVRQHLGISIATHDYKQTALSFAVHHQLPHHNRAEEHFSGDGVFAFLPLPGNASSIVWGTSPEHAAQLMALDDEDFNDALNLQLGDRLGRVTLRGKRSAYPLIKQMADHYVGPRIALLGDAAHAIHPLAGLGLNLGFKDAAALADILAQAVSLGDDLGSIAVLERYQMARRFDSTVTSFAMDAMNGLFVNDNPMLKLARDTGLRIIDHLPKMKSTVMGQAAGLSQNNPRLMQGLLPG